MFKSSVEFSSVNCSNDVFIPFILVITTLIMNYVKKKYFLLFFKKPCLANLISLLYSEIVTDYSLFIFSVFSMVL